MMMPETVPQSDDHAALIVNEFPSSTQDVITAITHVHGGFLQLAVIRRRDSVDGCSLGSRLGWSTSKTRTLAVARLDRHLQARNNLLCHIRSLRALSRQPSGFVSRMKIDFFSDSMTPVVLNVASCQAAVSTWAGLI